MRLLKFDFKVEKTGLFIQPVKLTAQIGLTQAVWLNARLHRLLSRPHLKLGILHEKRVNYFAVIEFISYHWLLMVGIG